MHLAFRGEYEGNACDEFFMTRICFDSYDVLVIWYGLLVCPITHWCIIPLNLDNLVTAIIQTYSLKVDSCINEH